MTVLFREKEIETHTLNKIPVHFRCSAQTFLRLFPSSLHGSPSPPPSTPPPSLTSLLLMCGIETKIDTLFDFVIELSCRLYFWFILHSNGSFSVTVLDCNFLLRVIAVGRFVRAAYTGYIKTRILPKLKTGYLLLKDYLFHFTVAIQS